jgi:hypothetical protein
MTIQLLAGFVVSTINIILHALATVAAIAIVRAIAFRKWQYPRLHLMGVMVVTVALLKFTHTLEIFVWALCYWLVGAAPAGTDVIYFAFVNYTTLGYGDVLPVQDWRLLGPMAAMTGILMFGWSTAVIFDVLVKMLAQLGATAAPGSPFSAGDRG